jgi:CheY-like chemotaxis protein
MGRIVLIVDDDSDDRDFFDEALHEIDSTIECRFAKNGQEALDLLNQSKTVLPDFIFLDLNMPRLGGKQCLRAIKKNKHLSNIPVVIFSTTKQDQEAEETKELGAVLFLTKPPTYTELVKRLSFVLSKTIQNAKS